MLLKYLIVFFVLLGNLLNYILLLFPDLRRSRNPVRRSNSSPEMSANWKNPFLNKDKLVHQSDRDLIASDAEGKLDSEIKKHTKTTYAKDMR